MFNRTHAAALAALMACAAMASPAAAQLTGDPNTDGWTNVGNSLTQGTFAAASDLTGGDFNFDVYRTSGTLSAAQGSFQAGDQIIGLGGICLGSTSGTANNCAIEALAKFGMAGNTFAPASTVGGTDGQADDSNGGAGYILTRIQLGGATDVVNQWTGSTFNPIANASDFIQFADVDVASQYVSPYVNGGAPTDTNRLQSWEIELDVTAMGRDGYANIPSITANGIVVMQGEEPGGYNYVDAFAPGAGGVPELAAWALMVLGFGGTGAMLRRHRAALAA